MSCIEHFCDYDDIADFPEHKHTSCEILYLKKGHISLVCGDEELDVTEEMMYIIPAGAVSYTHLTLPTICSV